MSRIGTLTTGAGVVTTIPGQAVCDQYLLLGDVDTAAPLTGLAVEIDGQPTINIQGSTPLVSVFAKFMSNLVASTIGLVFKIALGKIGKSTTYRFTNAGATTPAIFAFSENLKPDEVPNGGAVYAATKGINALSSDVFSKFSALFITDPANLTTVDILFKDGNRTSYTAVELDALFALKNPTEANGRLDAAVSGIDNRDQSIENVTINTGATGVTVLVIKLNDADFKAVA